MKKMFWQTAVAVAALLSGGCLQSGPTSAPAPVVVSPAPPVVTVTEPAPPPTATTAPAAEMATPAPASAPPAVVLEPPVTPQSAPPAIPTPAPVAEVKHVPAKPAAVTPPQPAIAAAPKVVTFKASYGPVTFNHQLHAGSNACSACHPTKPPAKLALGKDKAHQLCKGCHQQKGVPTQCAGCHKKG